LSNGYEVEVDGSDGRILDTESDGDDDDRYDGDDDRDDDDRDEAGTLDDGSLLLSEATITLEQAIAAAQGAAEGTLGDAELEYLGERLVFDIEIGNNDVKIDAADGSVVSVTADD
ncbi:MAG TPA: PepSY domain-containing protein, partial [Thermomicrobiales bacterium]|nr:PepSY domain-containing protein [Thermomicrobiales bacterium]